MNLNRREFSQTLAASALGAAASPFLSSEQASAVQTPTKPLPIIDTHQHLWNLKQFELPWLDGAPEVLKHNYLPADYASSTEGLNVVKAIYMEVDVAPQQQQAEAEYVIGLCKEAGKSAERKTVAAVISGRPAEKEAFAKYIAQFQDSPYVKGVRQVLHPEGTPRGLCLQEGFIRSMQLLGRMNLSYDLCMRPTELSDAAKLVDKCPDTRFILDHCGNADPAAFLPAGAKGVLKPRHNPDQWKRDILALAQRENVICKISGIVAGANENWDADLLAPPINFCLDSFGPKRVVFGGDWPVCKIRASYAQWVEALLAIISDRPLEEQKALLHDNAAREYGLS